jgi:hypothetical protein
VNDECRDQHSGDRTTRAFRDFLIEGYAKADAGNGAIVPVAQPDRAADFQALLVIIS